MRYTTPFWKTLNKARPTPGATPAEAQTRPYLNRLKEQDERKRSWLQPLEAVLDLLQRGQYLTANIGQDIWERKPIGDVLSGAWKGITGERKGTWKKTLFGGQDVGEETGGKGIFPGVKETKWDAPLIGPTSWQDVVGFVADVALDPLSWVSFGPTKLARSAAKKYSQQTVKQFTKQLGGAKVLPEIVQRVFSPDRLTDLLGKRGKDISKYLSRRAGKVDIAHLMNKVTKAAYKEGLQLNPKVVQSRLLQGLKEGQEEFAGGAASKLAKEGFKPLEELVGKKVPQEASGTLDELLGLLDKGRGMDPGDLSGLYREALEKGRGFGKELGGSFREPLEQMARQVDELHKVGADDFLEGFRGMGERSMRAFGKEFARGIREPNIISKSWHIAIDKLASTKAGGTFSDALHSAMNKGPVGWLRKAFGFRNPYQKMLRAKEMSIRHGFKAYMDDEARQIVKIWDVADDTTKTGVREVIAHAEMENIEDIGKVLSDPETLAKLGVKPEELEKVKDLVFKHHTYYQKLKTIEDGWVAEGMMPEFGARANYLPAIRQDKSPLFQKASTAVGSPRAGFTRQKMWNFKEIEAQEIAKNKWLFGLDDESAKIAFNKGWSTNNVDVEEMMLHRSMQHAQAKANKEMIEQFREFGIRFDDFSPADIQKNANLFEGLTREGGNLADLGLTQSNNELLKGYYFDKDVASIINRVTATGGSDEGLRGFAERAKAVSAWWRGFATLTPGFHLRNTQSNYFTLFMKFGPRALNPVKAKDAFFVTMHALGHDKLLKSMGLGDNFLTRILNKKVGNKTYRQIAGYAREHGVITRVSKGFDAETTVKAYTQGQKTLKKMNPFNNDNIAFKASRELGAVVESTPKFQSMLLDLEDMVRPGAENLTDDMLNFSMLESKKWFFDYDDLTDFEQKVMKNIIPFYCFPDTTEILTRSGWANMYEARRGGEALTYNVEQDICEWQKINDIAIFDFDDKLLRLQGAYADFVCTQDHRWPIEVAKTFVAGKHYGGNRKIVRSYELNTSHKLILSAPTKDQASILSVKDAEILGWVVTDGYHRWRGNHLEMMIYQSPQKHADYIRKLLGEYLTSESIHPDTGVICFRIGNGWGNNIKQYFHSKDDLPSIVTKLSVEAATAMHKAMFMAEGSIGKGGSSGVFYQFAQKRGPVLDAFQILCQILDKPFGYVYRPALECCYGYIRKTKRLKYNDLKKSYVPFKGKIWCPNTDNSTIIMRQNGKTIITGQTWIRKNVAHQLWSMSHHTQTYSMIPKALQMMREEGVDITEFPEYWREEGYVPTGPGEDGKVRAFRPDLPYKDINMMPFQVEMRGPLGLPIPTTPPGEMAKEFFGEFMSAAHPFLKTLASGAIGSKDVYDHFRKDELGPKGVAPRAMRLFIANPQILATIDGICRGFGVKDGLGVEKDSKGRLQINSRVKFILEQNLLPIQRLSQVGEAMGALVPQFDKLMEETTDFKDGYEGVEQTMRAMSFLFGIKQKDIDLDQQKSYRFRDLLEQAEKERAADRKKAPGYKMRSTRYAQSRMRKMRRMGL